MTVPPAGSLADALLAPLDRARTALWRVATARPGLRRLVVRRDTRLALVASTGVAATFTLAAIAPVLTFALSPLLLGIPHVASDVRYLLLRPRWPRAWLLLGAGLIAAMLAGRATQLFVTRGFPAAQLENALVFLWMLAGALLGARERGKADRLCWMLPLLAAAAVVIAGHARAVLLLFPHLHNVAALLLWVFLFRQRRRFALLPLAATALGAALLASGATIPWAEATGGSRFLGFSLADAGRLVAPGVSRDAACRIALLYTFLQSVHYAAWLVWIPQDQLRTESTVSFRQTARGLRRDFGRAGVAALLLSQLVLLGLAARDLYGTRGAYLLLANFHGLLEIATVVFLLAAGRRLIVPADAACR